MIRRRIEKCGRERGQDPVTEQSGLSLRARRPRSVRFEHRPSREEDVVQRSTRSPLLFYFFTYKKKLYSIIIESIYLKDSPLEPVGSLTTHAYILYIFGAPYTNNGLRKRVCAPNLSRSFGRCFAAESR